MESTTNHSMKSKTSAYQAMTPAWRNFQRPRFPTSNLSLDRSFSSPQSRPCHSTKMQHLHVHSIYSGFKINTLTEIGGPPTQSQCNATFWEANGDTFRSLLGPDAVWPPATTIFRPTTAAACCKNPNHFLSPRGDTFHHTGFIERTTHVCVWCSSIFD